MARRRRSSSPRGNRSFWSVLGLIVLLIIVYYLQERGGLGTDAPAPPNGQRPGATVGSGAVQAFFTTPDLIYPDRASSRSPTPIEQAIIADLDAARSSIEMATFEYNLISIAEALIRAKERGVTVRLALDRENLEKPEMADFAGKIEQAEIPVSWEETTAFLHSKFVIIDGATVWMGSWNATVNDTYRNNNNLLRITVPEIVANYAAEFKLMEGGTFGSRKDPGTPNPQVRVGGVMIENYFSPQDGVAQHLLEKLRGAKSSIRFLAFSFTSDDTKDALVERVGAGVTVQGVFETRNVGGTGSEFELLKAGGVDVLEDGNCYTMHHKLFIIDDRIVVTGSYNFTARAENINDENLIILDDPALAHQFVAEFERVYGQARQPTRCGG